MRTISLILVILLISCSSVIKTQQKKEVFYFYFDAKSKSQLMKKYHSWRNGPVNYLFRLDTENVIFTPREAKPNQKRKLLLPEDTLNINIKDIKWLNNFNSIQRDSIFLRKSNREFHIIEKDTIDNKLYLIDVYFVQEIE